MMLYLEDDNLNVYLIFTHVLIATVEDRENNIIAWNVEGFFDTHKGDPEVLFSYNSINDLIYGLAIIE
jgi:hypothetical protein